MSFTMISYPNKTRWLNQSGISLINTLLVVQTSGTTSPAHDEFYIKDNNGDFYLYYKNVYSEDVQVGWAKAKVDKSNNGDLNLTIDKINLALGGVDFIKNGYASIQAESKNYKLGVYYLDDNYEGAPYYQKQKITFKKINDTLLLDCKSYMNNPSVKDSFTGIFYGVCSDHKNVYFKLLK